MIFILFLGLEWQEYFMMPTFYFAIKYKFSED